MKVPGIHGLFRPDSRLSARSLGFSACFFRKVLTFLTGVVNIVDSNHTKRHGRCIRCLFSDREGASAAGSGPGFRQDTQFHTGAAQLN